MDKVRLSAFLGAVVGVCFGGVVCLLIPNSLYGTGGHDDFSFGFDPFDGVLRDVRDLETAAWKLQSAAGIRRPKRYTYVTLSTEGGHGGATGTHGQDASAHTHRQTIFFLRYKREAIGTFEISGFTAYQYYVDVAAVAWPERRALGCARIMGPSDNSRSYAPMDQPDEPDYSMMNGQLHQWIGSLPAN